MISFWRRGFEREASWDVHNAPSGDYSIKLRGAREERQELSYDDEFWMRCRISEIVRFAAPIGLFALDPRTVQALLDIHSAVYPIARHPTGAELVGKRRCGDYLRALEEDLRAAVRSHLLRVERLERPWPFVEKEEEPEQRAPAPTETAEDVKIKFFDLLNRLIPNAPYEVSAPGISKRGIAEDGSVILHNVGGATTCRVRWARPPDKRQSRNPDEPLSEFEFELELFLDAGAMGAREDVARSRLSNLGHHASDLDTALKGFQVSCGIHPTGSLDDAEAELNQRHDGCNPGREKLPRKRSTA